MRSFNNIALALLFCTGAWAQESPVADTTDQRNIYLPTGIRFGVDVLTLARNQYDKSFTGWEVTADVDLSRYYLAVDYGYWARTFDRELEHYDNDGSYFRAGVDVNFLTKDVEKNMFFIGGRYGRAVFSEHLDITKEDPLWGLITRSSANNHIQGRWFELTTGIRVRMWKIIWMGYTARFKFGLKTNENGDLLPHDVPGFGRTDKETTWGFNYQIFVRFPVRRQPKAPVAVP